MTRNVMIGVAIFGFAALIGCASAPKYAYECAAVGRHGVYAKWVGNYFSEVEAKKEAEKINKSLQGPNFPTTFPMCYLKEGSNG